jgi:hypothetical protein
VHSPDVLAGRQRLPGRHVKVAGAPVVQTTSKFGWAGGINPFFGGGGRGAVCCGRSAAGGGVSERAWL